MCTSSSFSCVLSHIFTQHAASMVWVEGPFWVPKFMQLLAWATVRSLAKSCVLLVICVCSQNQSPWRPPGQCGAGALARWQHPVASNKAWDVLHQAMRPPLYHRIRMAIEIASYSTAFFGGVDFIVGHNRSQRPCCSPYKLKLRQSVI